VIGRPACGWRRGARTALAVAAAAGALAGGPPAALAQGSPRGAGAPGAPTDDAAQIRRLRQASNEAIARHDTAGIGAAFADHVIVVTSRSDRNVGRQANLASFAAQFAARPDVTYRRSPREVRVFAPWGMASEAGEWRGSWTEPDGKVAIAGRYFAKWRRIGGRWLLESETYVPERCTGAAYCSAVP